MAQTSQINEVDMLQHRLATPVIQPRMYFFDKDKKPLTGGKVYSYKVGEDVFKPTYRNSELTAANTNPILLDSAGSALIYLRGAHHLKIYDRNGVFVEDRIVYQQQMRTQFFDKYGKALGGGKVWTYDYQSTIKKPSYENADDALLNSNPVILDENGWASISMVGAYRLRQYDKNGVFVGDQDFKRLPVKALTSRVYPLYFKEGLATIISIDQSILNNAPSASDNVETMVAIKSASIRDVLNAFSTNEHVVTKIGVIEATVEETRSKYQTANMPTEMLSTSTSLISAQIIKQIGFITHTSETEKVSTSFALTGAQITN